MENIKKRKGEGKGSLDPLIEGRTATEQRGSTEKKIWMTEKPVNVDQHSNRQLICQAESERAEGNEREREIKTRYVSVCQKMCGNDKQQFD